MPFLTNRKLNQHGFAHHFLVPVVAIVAVVGIGALVELRLSAAATTSCSTPTTPAIVTGNSGTCVQYAQQMVNGILAYMYLNSNGSDLTSRTNTVNNVINKWPLAKLDSAANFDVDNGFAALNATYGKQTGTNKINNVSHSDPYWVGQIQRDITSSSTETGRGFGGVSLTPFGKPSASGNVDNATWGMLCDASNHIQATSESNQNNSTDYAKGTSNKLAMWFVRSYMRAGISAASGANCSGILNPPKTTPPPAGKTGWTLTGTATLGKSTVAGGKATVPFTASVMNTGSASATFQYKTFYFFYDQPKGKTSTWPSPVNGAYAGETAITNDTATVAAGKSFSKSTSAANASFPATKNYASGDLVYLCVGIAFPASSTASTTLNGRSTVTGNQCVKVETGTGSAGGGGTAAPPTSGGGVSASSMTQCTTNPGNGQANNTVTELDNNTYHLQANEWNSGSPFKICTDGKNPDFTIQTSGISVPHNGAPGAYPSLYMGNHWGNHTAGYVASGNSTAGNLPVRNSDLMSGARKVTTSYTTTVANNSGGTNAWDDAYDNWYNSNPGTTSNNTGLEMMIWINHFGGTQPAGSPGPTVTLDGISWTVWYGGSGTGGTLSFVANNPVSSVSNLDLAPFTAYAVNTKKCMASNWYLIDVEAGFEPWTSGQGLTANLFNVTVH